MNLQTLSKEELLTEFFLANDHFNDVIQDKNLFRLIGTIPYIAAKRRLNSVMEEMSRRKKLGNSFHP